MVEPENGMIDPPRVRRATRALHPPPSAHGPAGGDVLSERVATWV